ncbi:Hypothetical_protein [Hexamita inflata]|uniref:Hypothetical_protein n=1 Tax=Hexamita inflata TaxID=28002 RepID=A0AA86PQ59_9EUKA|nr:Hypothetical protein HINF_LOCUS5689 [Hexamita inflata]CAI9942803.1 Hypothetical protein HINF_LOCUS30448 [Hexamita inflata]CAI9942806.1 Hypothetical protein HINF_LOCUS30451 [Hexamita inflata]
MKAMQTNYDNVTTVSTEEKNCGQFEQAAEVHQNRTKWCAVSWCSFCGLALSIVSIYFVISSMEDYYNIYQCMILSQCILVCIASFVGVLFSIHACFRVKSVSQVCFGATQLESIW